jgi:MFS superfamily sulfate permease-like transporter
LALVAIALPSQMATARLAGVPVVFGLYAFVAGTVLYALIGTNRHLSVGADSTIAPVLAVGVASIAVVGTSRYMTVMALAALLIGVVLIMVGVLRLGWIAEFLSTPVIGGVLGGIAVEIVVRQLPSVLGVSGGGTSTIGRISDVVSEVGSINGWSVGIAVGTFVLIAGGRRIDRRLPGAL